MNCLHDTDLLRWSEEQSSILRSRDFQNLDIDHIIEEIEAVGKSDQHALYSYLVVLLTHFLKKEYQPGMLCKSWVKSIINSSSAIKKILKRNPSYKRFLDEDLQDAYKVARLNAILETGLDQKLFPKLVPYEIDEILNEEEITKE
jgi:hypothetical protein